MPSISPETIELPSVVSEFAAPIIRDRMATAIALLPPGQEVDRVQVSIEREGGGNIKYSAVWLFTQKLIVEVRTPVVEGHILQEMARFKDAVDWVRLVARRYDLKQACMDSLLELEFTTNRWSPRLADRCWRGM